MYHAKAKPHRIITLLFAAFCCCGFNAYAQQKDQDPKAAAEIKRTNKESGRDPFKKYEPPRIYLKKPVQVQAPSLQERIEQYRAQKIAAMNGHVPAPKPTTALMLNEIQVVGISRTPRGYAAIVEATPIKMSYVIYPGEKFYDGQLVAIEDTRLRFRREVVWTDGRREVTPELKPLRQQNPIEAMTAIKTAPTGTTVADAEKKPDAKPAGMDKP